MLPCSTELAVLVWWQSFLLTLALLAHSRPLLAWLSPRKNAAAAGTSALLTINAANKGKNNQWSCYQHFELALVTDYRQI